jgi:hypothetical protein
LSSAGADAKGGVAAADAGASKGTATTPPQPETLSQAVVLAVKSVDFSVVSTVFIFMLMIFVIVVAWTQPSQ